MKARVPQGPLRSAFLLLPPLLIVLIAGCSNREPIGTLDDGSISNNNGRPEAGVPPTCGNGVINPGEQCDYPDLGGLFCQDLGFHSGRLFCTDWCRFDTSGCAPSSANCGNGVADPGEQCDGSDLQGESCLSLGFGDGVLACSPSCTFDNSSCEYSQYCGNGVAEQGEECDGVDLHGHSCLSLGLGQGTLACTSICTFDVSGCTPTSTCGNGVLEWPEQCDGMDFGGVTCLDLGFTGGILTCTQSCTLNTSTCTGVPFCGNGIVEPGEQCDDGNHNNNDWCLDDPNSNPPGTCETARCGDGWVWMGHEECDDGNQQAGDGCSPTCHHE